MDDAHGCFVVDVGLGTMRCGYCNRTAHWVEAALGYARLTGFYILAVEKATNTLVVLAEATSLDGKLITLPHHCENIPEDVHRRYAPPGTVLRRGGEPRG